MVGYGLFVWWVFLVLDWVVVTYIEPGSLFDYLMLRLAGTGPIAIVLVRLWRSPLPSRRMFAALDLGLCCSLILVVALMCVHYNGIASPYATGLMLVVVIRGSVLVSPWNRALLHLGVPALFYPGTLLLVASWSDEIAAQLSSSRDMATFAQYLFFVAGAVLSLTWGSHTAWTFRRQAFEQRSVGRYELDSRIGSGGMGEVWRAYDKTLKRDVALKLLRHERVSASSVARFEREVEATSLLAHPNTVRIFDYGVTDDGLWYYAMELLEGQDLAAMVATSGPLRPERAADLIRQAARAISEAHDRGIIHRDIKPENLFVARPGGEADVVKVLDFGIAKLLEQEAEVTLTQGNWIGGTPAYMSPEAARGQPATAASDVYGLGAVLYFALVGQPPFRGDNVPALLNAHVNEQVVPPSRRTEQPIPPAIEEVVLRCLSKDPADRFPDARALADSLA